MAMLPSGNWQFEKKNCSNQTMVRCDELNLNSIQVADPAHVVCLHTSETMPFVCVRNV